MINVTLTVLCLIGTIRVLVLVYRGLRFGTRTMVQAIRLVSQPSPAAIPATHVTTGNRKRSSRAGRYL